MHYFSSKTFKASDCIIIGIFKNNSLPPNYFNESQQNSLKKIIDNNYFTPDLGKTSLQYFVPDFNDTPLLLIGLGEQEKYTLATVRKAMSAAGNQLASFSATTVQIIFPFETLKNDALFLRQSIISLEDANIRRDHLKSNTSRLFWPKDIIFVGEFSNTLNALKEGQAIAQGIKRTKYLANLPSNKCTPVILAKQALEIAKQYTKLEAIIYDEEAIKALNMGCLLAVAQGSVQPPRLIVLHYKGDSENAAPTVLLGKGITFDSGGLCLKPPARMDEMKYDMCGAAAVLGTLEAAAELQLPLNLIGVIVCTENLPSGSAVKPGDIVTSMSGKTVEIINTDAEGRLVLCDGLTFIERFKPKAVIDIATLTGAIILTLGSEASGLMTNNEPLAEKITEAGLTSGDRTWQLPLWEEYQPLIDSAFADVANVGNEQAKSITAACFLARFAESFPWVHLDIAGTAWQGGGNLNRAATGRPVSLLMHYLLTSVAYN